MKLFFAGFAMTIVGRAVQLQVFNDPRLERLAKRQFNSKIITLPQRGLIFDRNGEGLAMSLKVRSLFFRPEILRKEATAAEQNHLLFNLAKILRMPVNGLALKARSKKGFVWVKRQLSGKEEQSIRDRGLLNYGDGVGLAEESRRFYPNKELAAHALGSVNVDGQGIEGLELFYEALLRGEQVRISSDKDAMGRKIFRDNEGLLAFKDGKSLVLTLDKAIQYEAEKALKNAVESYQAKSGSVIVAEVGTGEILAMANAPSFNPNNAKSASLDSRRNRAITDTYEPGSTFKPFVVALALEKGHPLKGQIYCERGSFKVGKHRISEAEAHEKFEWITMGEILKFSSNVGAAKIALDLGAANLKELMERLGVGRRTNIDLPGEASGGVNYQEMQQQRIRLANVGFGQGFTVTPLQMLSYYLSLANGGTWVQPKLVKAILSEDPGALEKGSIRYRLGYRFDILKTRTLFEAETAKHVSQMLETVVEPKGTGVQAALEEWSVAGKTGTSQKVDSETHRYSRTKHMASFIGFAPSKTPKLVALVLLDEPQKKFYASETAAPAFREIMRASLLRMGVLPDDNHARPLQLATIHEAPVEPVARLEAERNSQSQIRLPDLKGLSVREIMKSIGSEPLELEFIGSGVLKEQIPKAGQWLEAGAKLRLVFENEGIK